MNKKIKKHNNKVKIILILILSIILVFILYSKFHIKEYILEIIQLNNEMKEISDNNGDIIYSINIKENDIYYNNIVDMKLNINNFNENNKYKLSINIDDKNIINQELLSNENNIELDLEKEGKKNINIILSKNDIELSNTQFFIYYVEPYSEQYLDELSNKGIQVHYRSSGNWEDYETSLNSLEKLGVKNIRADIFYSSIIKKDNTYDFDYYDKWIKMASDKGINILLEFNGLLSKINTESKKKEFTIFVNEVFKRYPQVKKYEVLNEPNFYYLTK